MFAKSYSNAFKFEMLAFVVADFAVVVAENSMQSVCTVYLKIIVMEHSEKLNFYRTRVLLEHLNSMQNVMCGAKWNSAVSSKHLHNFHYLFR